MNEISHLAVETKTGYVAIDSSGMVELFVDGEKARRSPRQLMDLILADADSPRGTFVCPICGHDEPHSHDADTVEIERFVRPAFEKFLAGSSSNLVAQYFKEGYYLAYGATMHGPRSDGGWAERQGRTGPYKREKLQAAWMIWLASWQTK